MKRLTLMLAAFAALFFAAAPPVSAIDSKEMLRQFRSPDARYRPFVRWWWNGDKVEADELVRELHLLKDAGIAGVEINPISFPGGNDVAMGKKSLEWLSGEWIDMLKVVFDEASRIGMTCDLIVGSGWPFGSENLAPGERAEVMLIHCQKVTGGKLFETSKFHIYKELDPGVTKTNPRRVPELVKMLLVPDPVGGLEEAVDITSNFDGETIRYNVPEGSWQIYTMVKYENFASVINGAPGAAGSILDHMNQPAVQGYLDRMQKAIEAKLGPLRNHIRAYFVDSMELEGTNWTGDFAEQFKARRGYDILPWLPFTMFKVGRLGEVKDFNYGCKKSDSFQEQVNRARFDFELTKAELLEERFFRTYEEWCRAQGVKSRAQGYGCGFFIEETSLGLDIPEGESWTTNWLRHRIGEEMGDEDYRRGRGYTMIDKYVSSAAHLSGKRVVSAEEMTNTYLVFNTSLEFLKVGSDMAAMSGITPSIRHGFNYCPADAPFPGWVQYGSFYNERNPWWPYWHKLNDYRARLASVFQNSEMCTDIAILPANYDMWSEMGVQTEPFPVKLNVPYTSLVWEAIHKNGGGADYVSEIILKGSTVKNGRLCYGPKSYGVIFLVDVKSTTIETARKLREFVRQGGKVFCIGQAPSKSLGLQDFEKRDAEIAAVVGEMQTYKDNFIVLDRAEGDHYLEWYRDLAQKYSLPHAVTISSPDRFLLHNHYLGDDKSDIFFLQNAHMSEHRSSDLIFPASVTKGRKAWLYDPADGQVYRIFPDRNGRFNLDLGPSESVLIVFNKLSMKAPAWTRKPLSGRDSLVLKDWKLTLCQPKSDKADTTMYAEMPELKDLIEVDAYKNFFGTVTYRTSVRLDAGSLPRYINLGKVGFIAEVSVNGKPAGTYWFGESVLDAEGLFKAGDNSIEVKVTTLMGNYMQTLKDNKVAQRYVIKRKHPLRSSGLIGPVTLYR